MLSHVEVVMANNLQSMDEVSLHSGYFHETLRSWQSSSTNINSSNFIYPVFISPDDDAKEEIKSLPLQYRLGLNHLVEFLKPIVQDGLKTVLLFSILEDEYKNKDASMIEDQSANKVIGAIKLLKKNFPGLIVACDVCLCSFTSHGHCGLLKSDGKICPWKTNEHIVKLAFCYALAGCDILAPSDMTDGRVGAIAAKLKKHGFREQVCIMSYSAKFASCFYGPFRDAAGSAPQFGDRRCYQLPPGAKGLAIRAAKRDIAEGADVVMVKPGMPYLDIVQQIKSEHPEYPVAVYQVSGEYAMLYHAAMAGAFELEKALHETMTCMRRAGADIIITYFTPLLLKMLKKMGSS